eukprot:1071838-Rhodomonas_salina.8
MKLFFSPKNLGTSHGGRLPFQPLLFLLNPSPSTASCSGLATAICAPCLTHTQLPEQHTSHTPQRMLNLPLYSHLLKHLVLLTPILEHSRVITLERLHARGSCHASRGGDIARARRTHSLPTSSSRPLLTPSKAMSRTVKNRHRAGYEKHVPSSPPAPATRDWRWGPAKLRKHEARSPRSALDDGYLHSMMACALDLVMSWTAAPSSTEMMKSTWPLLMA